jgi:hypothetical protein
MGWAWHTRRHFSKHRSNGAIPGGEPSAKRAGDAPGPLGFAVDRICGWSTSFPNGIVDHIADLGISAWWAQSA